LGQGNAAAKVKEPWSQHSCDLPSEQDTATATLVDVLQSWRRLSTIQRTMQLKGGRYIHPT